LTRQKGDRRRNLVLSNEVDHLFKCTNSLSGGGQGLSAERSNRAMTGGPIELEQMGSAGALLAVHCLYAGGYFQRRGCA
jgi:hypothetical protein